MGTFITDALEATARRLPTKRGVVCGEESMTFAEFDALTNQVSQALIALGGAKGDRVGICLEKSHVYVALQFGTLKAAAAYVPIDYAFPVERKLQILEDCGIRVLFTSESVAKELRDAGLFDRTKVENVVVVEGAAVGDRTREFSFVKSQVPERQRVLQALDSDLAYVMYTSGSTGKPKGVMITHRNIMTFMEWCDEKLGIGEDDVVAQTAPFTFDISGLDTYNAIRQGATLVVVKNQLMINTILAAVQAEKVTFMSTVPTVFGAIVERPQLFKRYDLSSLRVLVSGAAACPAIFMKKLHEHLPKARLVNIYGPTEATIYCTYFEIDPAELDVDKPVSIGKAFENTEAFVVTPEGRECAPEEVGELILRGTHVSPGYYLNAEKTDAAFKTFPLLPHLNEKAYFTGDLARKDAKGNIFFLGRKDDMIKSRGYRIELAEIEIALSSRDEELAQFCAVAVPDPMIENEIWAAVVFREGKVLTEEALLAHCKQKLPEYMVPARVFVTDHLPQTTSGKVSRRDIVQAILAGPKKTS
jgi:amino acid adenylation domain-containing protein